MTQQSLQAGMGAGACTTANVLSTNALIPKSVILASPLRPSKTLAGLMSLCTCTHDFAGQAMHIFAGSTRIQGIILQVHLPFIEAGSSERSLRTLQAVCVAVWRLTEGLTACLG